MHMLFSLVARQDLYKDKFENFDVCEYPGLEGLFKSTMHFHNYTTLANRILLQKIFF